MTQTAELEIVWRNSKPPKRQQRWEQISQDSGTAQYLVQECLCTDVGSSWSTASRLESSPRWSSRLVSAKFEPAVKARRSPGDRAAA